MLHDQEENEAVKQFLVRLMLSHLSQADRQGLSAALRAPNGAGLADDVVRIAREYLDR